MFLKRFVNFICEFERVLKIEKILITLFKIIEKDYIVHGMI